jgi:hypothetical protein
MSTKQSDNKIPYGVVEMQDVTVEMNTSKLSCLSEGELVDMMCHEGL